MTTEQVERYRALLEEIKRELLRDLNQVGESTSPVAPDSAIGRLTRQDAMLSQQMAIEVKRRHQVRLGQVEQALRRVAEGTFGFCAKCAEEISEPRLRVRPETPLCIDCAQGR
jgi:DnaK suppressor protein